MIEGVSFSECDSGNAWLCDVSEISDDLKTIIKRDLSCICHGDYASQSGLNSHEYKSTIREFLVRYQSKHESVKKGMIGEMLAQLILREYLPEFRIASPYFNQEEKSIRKGFDIVAYQEGKHELWITEVKSGNRRDDQLADDKSDQLFTDARNDLHERLNSNNATLWYNAINSARNALCDSTAKNAIISALDRINTDVSDSQFSSSNSNVFLVAVIYGDSRSKTTLARLSSKCAQIRQDEFNGVIAMSIQKDAFVHIANFLESEAE